MIDIQGVTQELMKRTNVIGVGIGFKRSNGQIVTDADGNPKRCVIVSVEEKMPINLIPNHEIIPLAIDGTETDVVQTGAVSILQEDFDLFGLSSAPFDPKMRQRPLLGGLSIGLNPGVSAGTLGLFVHKRSNPSKPLILSNWHVLAHTNVPIEERTTLNITQPGNTDEGSPESDTIGKLLEFVPIIPDDPNRTQQKESDCNVAAVVATSINWVAKILGHETRLVPMVVMDVLTEGRTNLVDAALASMDGGINFDNEIRRVGKVDGSRTAELGMKVHKFGRTTGYTTGTITQVNATFSIKGYEGKSATFTDQLVITGDEGPFLKGGDSGSALVALDNNNLVGLNFAGSSMVGIANRWEHVRSALDVDIL